MLQKGSFSLDQLSESRRVMDRGGLTKAGRALDKHGGRPGSVFPKATGNPSSKSLQGQYLLDDILTHPNNSIKYRKSNRFGDVVDIEVTGVGGVRFLREGDFVGFLEP